MTTEEAIDSLKANYPDSCYELLREAVDMAIEALEKQIPKKPIFDTGTYARRCPSCNHTVSGFYCWNCGQHLKWEEKE